MPEVQEPTVASLLQVEMYDTMAQAVKRAKVLSGDFDHVQTFGVPFPKVILGAQTPSTKNLKWVVFCWEPGKDPDSDKK